MPVAYAWRGAFTAAELNVLHAEGFEHDLLDWDWREQVERHSLGWVTARADFEDHLRAFYFNACGFTPTNAGLIEL